MPRVDASASVLDAAERLFGAHGIATVSDRKVAEAAANSNHSAVRYYFGGRDGLLEALVRRHEEQVVTRRGELQAAATDLLGDIRAMVLPHVEVLGALGPQSWRGRFLAMAYADPGAVAVIRSLGRDPVTGESVFASIRDRLADLDPRVLGGRARLMGHMLVTACADLEERRAAGEDVAWDLAGWFLCDAIAGMLRAPVSTPPAGALETWPSHAG